MGWQVLTLWTRCSRCSLEVAEAGNKNSWVHCLFHVLNVFFIYLIVLGITSSQRSKVHCNVFEFDSFMNQIIVLQLFLSIMLKVTTFFRFFFPSWKITTQFVFFIFLHSFFFLFLFLFLIQFTESHDSQ